MRKDISENILQFKNEIGPEADGNRFEFLTIKEKHITAAARNFHFVLLFPGGPCRQKPYEQYHFLS